MSKKVLIITDIDRCSSRILGLAKYLSNFGWEPIILTPKINKMKCSVEKKIKIIKTSFYDCWEPWKKLLGLNPEKKIGKELKERFCITSKKHLRLLRLFYSFIGGIINYPDEERGWIPFAIQKCEEILKKEKIDIILSSSSPVSSHIIAKEIKKRYKIPWVADMRDLWSQNHNYPYCFIRKIIDRKLEIRTLGLSDGIVTVSKPLVQKLKKLHKRPGVYCITNGFDSKASSRGNQKTTKKITIVYTGQIYFEKQDPTKLFVAIYNLIKRKKINETDIRIDLYGTKEGWIQKEIENYGLSKIIKQHGVVSKTVALKKQKEADILLLLNWEDEKEIGLYSLKIFEYLSAKKPILVVGGPKKSVVNKLIYETRSGFFCQTADKVEKIIEKLYLEYKKNRKIKYRGLAKKIKKYSYSEMTRKFVNIFNKLSKN